MYFLMSPFKRQLKKRKMKLAKFRVEVYCLHHMHGAPFKAVKSQNPSKHCIQGARLELEQHLTKLCNCLQWSLHPNCQFKLIRNTIKI